MNLFMTGQNRNRLAGLCISVSVLFTGAPAWARVGFLNFERVDLESVLNDRSWGAVIAAALVLGLVIAAYVTYRRSPTYANTARIQEDFWRSLPSDNRGFKGVLYADEILGAHFGAGPYIAQRIRVELRHDIPSKSRVLFRNEEQPNALAPDAVCEAMTLWVKTAKERDLPAVYTTRHGIHTLAQGHIADMDKDPEGFMKKFQSCIQRRKPLPAL